MEDRVITDDIDFHVYLGGFHCLGRNRGVKDRNSSVGWLYFFLDLQCLIDDDDDDDDDDEDDDEDDGLLQGHWKTSDSKWKDWNQTAMASANANGKSPADR